jgi:hypothetical protein
MATQAGNRGKGRPKGSRNKLTKTVREAFDEAIAVANATEGMSLKDWAVRDMDSNQKFWLAAIQTMPKNVDLTSGNKPLASAVIHVPIPMTVDEWEQANS